MSREKIEKQLKEAKEELATLKKMGASADEIEFAEDEVKELEAKLKAAPSEEKKSEPSKKGAVTVRAAAKKEEPKKATAEKKDKEEKSAKRDVSRIMRGGKKKMLRKPARVEKKSTPSKPEKKRGRKPLPPEMKKKRSKGLSVVYNGKTYTDTDPEFCNILIKQLEDRKKKRKEASKSRPASLSSKVGDNIASSVVTAIRGAYKDNKDEILDNKASANKFIKTIERIESAAEKFVSEMKSILADNFKQKDFDKEFKDVEEVIKKIKETIKKSFE